VSGVSGRRPQPSNSGYANLNVATLQILLQRAVANTTRTVDYLLLAKAIESMRMGQVRTVATFANLPSSVANLGLLVYVEADQTVYWSAGPEWITLASTILLDTWAWGLGTCGRVGDDTVTTRSSPVSAVGGFTDWCQVSAGDQHSLGVRTDGTAWAWGLNTLGRLGDNTAVNKSSPVSVVGGFTDWCQVAAGCAHSLGVRQNGTAWAWGCNPSGQLGDNTAVSKSSPVQVAGLFTNWCQVSAGTAHSLGVRTDGSLWAWGLGTCGRVGDGTVTTRSSPVSVVGSFADWCQVSAGDQHSLGVRTNGSAWAWGLGLCGRLGDGTVVNKSSPISVVGGFNDWCYVSAGNSHSLGVRQNGTLWAWGLNGQGRLGDNTATLRSSPVSVVGGFTDWCQAAAGNSHSLGVRQNGTAWAWGCNPSGQLGDNTAVSKSSPVSVAGGFAGWCQVSAGTAHSLAVKYRTA
jgi:alpha-tubulin suppressor-like RCC1 family protein